MSGPDDEALDFTLRWKETEAPRESGHDSVLLGIEETTEPTELHPRDDEESLGQDPSWHDSEEEPSVVESDGEESFQWSAEREAELEAALESIPTDAPARVHQQLTDIANALEAETLDRERALKLLSEVDNYLAARIQAEHDKPPVTHDGFMSYRGDKLNALYAWQEAATALRVYCTDGEEVQLKVAFYAAEQAAGFLLTAWETLQTTEPEELDTEETSEPDEPEGVEEEPQHR